MQTKYSDIRHFTADAYFDAHLPAEIIFYKQELTLWHDHDFYELALVVAGQGFHKTLERKTPVKSGSLLFVKPGEVHSYQVNSESLSIINVLIKPVFFENAFLTNLLQGIAKTECIAQLAPDSQSYKRLRDNLQLLKDEENSERSFRFEMFSSLIYEVLCISARSFSSYETDPATRKYNELIAAYINENLNRKPCLEDISGLTGLSASHITRNFKNITGYTFVEMINEYRIQKICGELVNTDKDIEEIYNQSGYKNKVYFHRAFKRVTGVSPLQYRKQLTKIEFLSTK